MTERRSQHWVLIAAGYGVGIAGMTKLTGSLPILESVLIATLLPFSATVIFLSATSILAHDPSNTGNRSLWQTYHRILFDVILFIVALHALIVATLVGVLPSGSWLARAPIVLFGLLGMCVGNLLPRTRPNLAIGIRTPRTLTHRDIWMLTHRRAGALAVAFGFLFVVCGAFFSKQHLESALGTVSVVAVLLLVAEHLRSRTV